MQAQDTKQLGEAYVLDATLAGPNGMFCFCPVELDEEGNVESVIIGLNFLSTQPPVGSRLIGITHEGGQEACEEWCAEHADELEKLGLPHV